MFPCGNWKDSYQTLLLCDTDYTASEYKVNLARFFLYNFGFVETEEY